MIFQDTLDAFGWGTFSSNFLHPCSLFCLLRSFFTQWSQTIVKQTRPLVLNVLYTCIYVYTFVSVYLYAYIYCSSSFWYAVVLNARCGLPWNYHSLPQCADANNSLMRPNDHSISSLPSPEATIYLSTAATAAASVSLVLRNVTKHDRRTFADSTDRGTRRCASLSIYCRFHFQSRCRRNRLLNEESLQRSTFPSSIVC